MLKETAKSYKKTKKEYDLFTLNLSRSNGNQYKSHIQLRLAPVFGRFVHLAYSNLPAERCKLAFLRSPLSLIALLVLVRREEHVSSNDATTSPSPVLGCGKRLIDRCPFKSISCTWLRLHTYSLCIISPDHEWRMYYSVRI